MGSGDSLPSFITFNPLALSYSIETSNKINVGVYKIALEISVLGNIVYFENIFDLEVYGTTNTAPEWQEV